MRCMSNITVMSSAVQSALQVAALQAEEVYAITSAFAGDVQVQVRGAGVIRQTITLSACQVDTNTTPRRILFGKRKAITYVSEGSVDTLRFLKTDGTPIFETPSGGITCAAAKNLCPVAIDSVAITANSLKQILTSATWNGVVDTENALWCWIKTGTFTNYPLQFKRKFPSAGAQAIDNFARPYLDGTPVAQWQCDVQEVHPNGKLKEAIISMIVPSISTTQQKITFQNSVTADNTPATLASLLAGGVDFDAQIRVAVSGTPVAGSPISARAMAQAVSDSTLASNTAAFSPNSRYHTKGPICTTFIFADNTAKTYDVGTDANKVIRGWFDVQYWPTISRVNVIPCAQICDTTKLKQEAVDLSFWTGNGTPVKRDEKLAMTFPVLTFVAREYWIGSAIPTHGLKHGMAYLAEVRATANHDPNAVTTPAIEGSYETAFAALDKSFRQPGFWNPNMPNTGGRTDLYARPQWLQRAFYDGWPVLWEVSKHQAFAAGSWQFFNIEGDGAKQLMGANGQGKIIGRCTGGRPDLFYLDGSGGASQLGLIGSPTLGGVEGWNADLSHNPNVFADLYMVTGRYFWLDRLQIWASNGIFHRNPGTGYSSIASGRSNLDLIPYFGQLRGLGWHLLRLAEAWYHTPSTHTQVKSYFTKALADAMSYLYGVFGIPGKETDPITQAWEANYATHWGTTEGRPNRLHFPEVGPYNGMVGLPPDAQTTGGFARWQLAYVEYALNRLVEMGVPDSLPVAQYMSKFGVSVCAHPERYGHVTNDSFPTKKLDGTFFQSAEDLLDGYSGATGTLPNYMTGNLYNGGGAINTYAVHLDTYATTNSGVLALAYHHELGRIAWERFLPFHDAMNAAGRWGWDQRWCIVPRATP